MSKKLMILVSPSNYGTIDERMRVVGARIKQEYQDVEVSFLFITHKNYRDKIQKHLQEGGFVLSCDTIGASMVDRNGDPLFQQFKDRIFVWITKEPWIYADSLAKCNWAKRYFVTDRMYRDYVRRLTGKEAQFLPIPGYDERIKIPKEKKSKAVFIAATYLNPEDREKQLNECIPTALEPFFGTLLKKCLKSNGQPLNDLIEESLKEHGFDAEHDLIETLIQEYGTQITDYCCRKNRKDLITFLVDQQIPVVVYGQNWQDYIDTLTPEEKAYIAYPGKVTGLKEMMKITAKYAVTLDITGGFPGDPNMRVATGLHAGCHVLTMKNEQTMRLAREQKALSTYLPGRKASLVKKIRKLFSEEERIEASNLDDYSVGHFAEVIYKELQ